MDGDLQKSWQLGYPANGGDAKYVSGLSTILVATIQEAKDRISQIEYIFCSQLFPTFQSKSKSLQQIYSDARKAAEDTWKDKENDLLHQIEKLHLEKEQLLVENQSLKLENAKFVNTEVQELQRELLQKSKEVDEGMEVQKEFLKLLQSKEALIVTTERQLKAQEKKTNELLVKLESLENKYDKVQEQLCEKTEEVDRSKELQDNLLKKIDLQASNMANTEHLLNDYEKEKSILTAKLQGLEDNVDFLQKELRKKIEEAKDGQKVQEQLLQQIDLDGSELLKAGQELEEIEKEKKLLLTKLKGLEEQVNQLQEDLRVRSNELAEGMELHGKLLQQIEAKNSDLLSEKSKRRNVIAAYKKLKSQHDFLCKKLGLTAENMLSQSRIEDRDSLTHNQNPVTSPDIENKVRKTSSIACKLTQPKEGQESSEDDKGFRLIQRSSSVSPFGSSSSTAEKLPTNVKSCSPGGTKRPVPHWRDTRSHQIRGGPDPHDDFLDTPLENIRGNIKKTMKEVVHDLPQPNPKDMNFDNSDDETQDMNVDPGPEKKQIPPPQPGIRGFKYVEPVRKKSDRENLKGIECKQCKKFYDAVLPDGGKDIDGNKQNLRCEHHDGVSRHRYRYAPPLTPEGFWNIGFESEM
ncbi:unnamed protein product [Ilex paraguariensis]|uniref:DNA endonuclease activator Ctp1 C-terminal domain-containing protein n=1 Tax=Ilex paraguariensis TaxID=185542 RepID=A0ABC8SGE8_9AQUA